MAHVSVGLPCICVLLTHVATYMFLDLGVTNRVLPDLICCVCSYAADQVQARFDLIVATTKSSIAAEPFEWRSAAARYSQAADVWH